MIQEAPIRVGATLARVFEEARIVWVDVGARGGSFPPMRPLAPHARLVAVEPEPEEATRLGRVLRSEGWRDSAVAEVALGSRGRRTLRVTRQPGLTSLLPPDLDIVGRFFDRSDWEVVKEIGIDVVPWESAAYTHGFEDACFVKVDTQGSELEILRSGGALLDGLVGAYVEVEFQPFYRGQPLFADVDAEMRARGLGLSAMHTVSSRSYPASAPYADRTPVWAHALYLRDPRSFAASGDGRGLVRWLAVALCMDQFDAALRAVREDAAGPRLLRGGADLEPDVLAWAEARARVALSPTRVLGDGLAYLRRGKRRWTDPVQGS